MVGVRRYRPLTTVTFAERNSEGSAVPPEFSVQAFELRTKSVLVMVPGRYTMRIPVNGDQQEFAVEVVNKKLVLLRDEQKTERARAA